jgi:hypothetical protein
MVDRPIPFGIFVLLGSVGALMWYANKRDRNALSVVVSRDEITMVRHGAVVDIVRWSEVGLVVLYSGGWPDTGLVDLEIYDPDRDRVGEWKTCDGRSNKLGSLRSMSAFRRFGYPWVLYSTWSGSRNSRSKSVPPWTDEVLDVALGRRPRLSATGPGATVPPPVMAKPVVAPRPTTTSTVTLRQTRWHDAAFVALLFPYAILVPLVFFEKFFGVGAGAPGWSQTLIVPASLSLAWIYLRRRFRGRSAVLTVGPDALCYDGKAEGVKGATTVSRSDVGLVIVCGGTGGRDALFVDALIVHDSASSVLAVWKPRWFGRPTRALEALRAAGYPALMLGDVYDGRFQEQVEGEPPRAVAP